MFSAILTYSNPVLLSDVPMQVGQFAYGMLDLCVLYIYPCMGMPGGDWAKYVNNFSH